MSTQISDLSGRVVDGYTNMPIGAVIYGADAAFHAHAFFPDEIAGETERDEIQGDWGPRFDRAVDAIWRQYWKQFWLKERVPRLLWRWQRIGWLILGTILGAVTQLMLRNL